MADARQLVADCDSDGDWAAPTRTGTLPKRILGGALGLVALGLVLVGVLHSGRSGSHLRSGNIMSKTFPEHVIQRDVVEDVTDPDACDKYPYLKFEKTLHNNLDGQGPDQGAEGMKYRVLVVGGTADMFGKEIDLHVHAVSKYTPFASRLNGMQGKYGTVNLKSGSDVNVEYSFWDPETQEPIVLKKVALTFFDLDQDDDDKSVESFTTSGFERYYVMKNTEVVLVNNSDGTTTFHSSTYGDGEDNPRDPMFLTSQQKNRAVSMLFDDASKIKVNLKASAGVGPRFFTYVGRPSLLCAVTVQKDALPPLVDLDYQPPWEVPVEAGKKMIFKRWTTEVGKEVEKGDPLCVVEDADGHEFTYYAPTDGTVKALQDGLNPGDEIQMRLSDHTLAVIRKPSFPELPKRAPYDGRVIDQPVNTPAGMTFVKWHVTTGDAVRIGDPIADVEDADGKVTTLKAPSNGFVMSYQEGLKPRDPLDDALEAKDLAVIGLLPPIECNKKIGQVETNADAGASFQKWHANFGDIVKKGDPIADIKLADGTITTLKADKAGMVVYRQNKLRPGMVVDETIEDNNLATIGKVPALVPKAFESGTFAGEDMIFKEWLVKVDEIVKKGDPVAIVQDADGTEHTIYAPKYGTVVARQEYLTPGLSIDKSIMDDDLVVVGKFPELVPGFRQDGVNADLANTLPEGTTMTEQEWKDAIFVQWFVDQDEQVDHNTVIAQIASGAGTGANPIGSELAKENKKVDVSADPDTGFVKWAVDDPTKQPVGVEVGDPLFSLRRDSDVGGRRSLEDDVLAKTKGWLFPNLAAKLSADPALKEDDNLDPSWTMATIVPALPELPTRPDTDAGRIVDHPLKVHAHSARDIKVFVKWLIVKDQAVSVGDGICVVENAEGEEETLVAHANGFVNSYQEQLLPQAPLEYALEAHDLAVIGLLPKIPCDESKGEVPTLAEGSDKFDSFLVSLGDKVLKGDDIATVVTADGTKKTLKAKKDGIVVAMQSPIRKPWVIEETIEDDNLATIGEAGAAGEAAFVPVGFKRVNVTAPGWGKVASKNPLVPGEKIGDQQYGSNIVVLDQGYPWWLLLLCACLCLCYCCFPILYYVMKKEKPVYKALAPVVVAPPQPVAAPLPVPPPPPPPVAPLPPPGTRLDFVDPLGVIHTYYAMFRPLGIKHGNIAPIIAHEFTPNAYAADNGPEGLKIKAGYKLTRVGETELYDDDNFPRVEQKIADELKQWPVWQLPLTFAENADGSGAQKTVKFATKPIGIQFSNRAPIKVDKVYEGSPAEENGTPVGWYITSIGEVDCRNTPDFKELRTLLGEGVKPLDLQEDAKYKLTDGIAPMFSNQDGQHKDDNDMGGASSRKSARTSQQSSITGIHASPE